MIKNIKVNPSILDCFSNVLTGKYNKTESDLIQMINKTSAFKQTEAMMKGVAFHSLTDGSIVPYRYDSKREIISVEWFEFDAIITNKIIEERRGFFHEQWLSREIETRYGSVLIYGKCDDVGFNKMKDLKTCSQYYKECFSDSNQWRMYLYAGKSNSLTYLITDFTCIYYEEYFNYCDLEIVLRSRIEKYCEFLNDNIEKINIKNVTF